MTDPRRTLPSVDRLLRDPGVAALMATAPRNVVVAAVRDSVEAARVANSAPEAGWVADVSERVRRRVTPSLQPVLNATGVVLHTNLGRAPLARAAVDAIAAVSTGYSTLEFDLATGERGSRSDHCAALLAELTGAQDALVVNNAAAALVLALNTLAEGREVLISRGELVEIGGSFRIPDIMAKSGAVLKEVGTTNRTHLDDYRRAMGARTGAILTVHRSNFEQSGFVASPNPEELAGVARECGLPYLYDVGSGLLADLSSWGLRGEPRVQDAVGTGAALVVFSGDKLLGGPQAGCLVGDRTAVAACRANPHARAARADKMTLAGLEATLSLYQDPERARQEIPVLRMLTEPLSRLEERAGTLAAALPDWCQAVVVQTTSAVGGGSFPGASLPTAAVALDPGPEGADALARRLRLGGPPIIGRIAEGKVLLDPRTLPEDSAPVIVAALTALASP